MNLRYFTLDGEYDMADHLAAAGLVVVAIDHPGVGDSDVPDDPWALTAEAVSDIDAAGVSAVVTMVSERFSLRDPIIVGAGHSMGAMLTVFVQARHRLYDGLALFGYSGRGLPEVLSPDEIAYRSDIVSLAKERFGLPLPIGETAGSEMLLGPAAAEDAVAALTHAISPLLVCCGLLSMIPKSHIEELAAIDVPVFNGVGEHDITGPPHEVPTYFTSSNDVTLHVLRGAFHNSNAAPNRREQWDRFIVWANTVP
jgi:pimeloyl-ACP methyl ester carboxylesterase